MWEFSLGDGSLFSTELGREVLLDEMDCVFWFGMAVVVAMAKVTGETAGIATIDGFGISCTSGRRFLTTGLVLQNQLFFLRVSRIYVNLKKETKSNHTKKPFRGK